MTGATDDEVEALIPWQVQERHGVAYPLAMLRVEARRRAGEPLRPIDLQRVISWKLSLDDRGVVVDYDPDTAEGFHYVPRRIGIDWGPIREISGG